MKRAYKMRHVLIDWTSRPMWLLSDTGQWAPEIPPGYEAGGKVWTRHVVKELDEADLARLGVL
jgi:hypothetical protein